jgi:hypothetical protein
MYKPTATNYNPQQLVMMVLVLSHKLSLAVWIRTLVIIMPRLQQWQPWNNKKLCVYPIPNAYITVGGTDPNYGATGPAYFNTGSPIANTAKFVKHSGK